MSRSDGYGIRRRKLFLPFDGEPPTRRHDGFAGVRDSFSASAHKTTQSTAGARDFGRRLPLRSRLLSASIFSCQRSILQAVYPWGLGWSRRARAKSRVHRLSDSRIASGQAGVNRLLSLCCRFSVDLLSGLTACLWVAGRAKVFVFRMMEGVVPTLANNLNVAGPPRTRFPSPYPCLYDSE